MFPRLFSGVMALILGLILALPVAAAELRLAEVQLTPCAEEDPGRQPDFSRPLGASCYVLSGNVDNPGRRPIVDTDVYARILDSSGEPVLQNRTRVGSIGDVPPGVNYLCVAIGRAGWHARSSDVRNARARGSMRRSEPATEDDDLLPLEQGIEDTFD